MCQTFTLLSIFIILGICCPDIHIEGARSVRCLTISLKEIIHPLLTGRIIGILRREHERILLLQLFIHLHRRHILEIYQGYILRIDKIHIIPESRTGSIIKCKTEVLSTGKTILRSVSDPLFHFDRVRELKISRLAIVVHTGRDDNIFLCRMIRDNLLFDYTGSISGGPVRFRIKSEFRIRHSPSTG